jgi:hypothetical protein
LSDTFSGVTRRRFEQHHIAAVTLDEGADGGLAFPHDEVAFPVAGHGTILDLGWTLGDHDHVTDLALRRSSLTLGSASGPASAETLPELFA